MGRTLHFRILADKPLPSATWHAIERIERAMSQRFTWTCESLKLEPVDDEDREQGLFLPDLLQEQPLQANGITKVRDDEWNAVLVLRYVQWLSRLVPEARVKVTDEGDYVLCGDLIFEAGEGRPDSVRIVRQCAFLDSQGLRDELRTLAQAAAHAHQHRVYYANVPANDYADRTEIASLKDTRDLSRITLNDAADCLPFPWQDQAQ